MATSSVATPVTKRGSTHDLWLGDGSVLTLGLDRDSKDSPPAPSNIVALNAAIQGLARAAKSVAFHAEAENDGDFTMQPIEDIANAIVLLSQLSDAVHSELNRE